MKKINNKTGILLLLIILMIGACHNNEPTNQPGNTDSLVRNPNQAIIPDTIISSTDTAHHKDTSTQHKY